MTEIWTDERLATLKRCWDAGMSAAETAREIGGGVTRAAVAGKTFRLGWLRSDLERRVAFAFGAATTRAKLRAAAPAPAPKRPASLPPPTPCAVAPRLVGILELGAGECRWPYEAGEGFLFCGRAARPGRSYCREHHRVAYEAVLAPTTPEKLDPTGRLRLTLPDAKACA